MQGENAWIFVNEEEVASATKAYFAFEKELKEAVPREQRAAFKPCKVTGAVVDGKPLDPVSDRPAILSRVPVLARAACGDGMVVLPSSAGAKLLVAVRQAAVLLFLLCLTGP